MKKQGGLIFGVAINDYANKTENGYMGAHSGRCPIYRTWFHIVRRCYDSRVHLIRPTYTDCKMHESWHLFSVFSEWMKTQDWPGMHIDKDILLPGNKIYGPDTCVFITPNLNVFLTDRSRARGSLPLGVHLNDGGKYRSRCWNPFSGKRELIGDFSDPDSAHEAWRSRKHQHACRYADMQTNTRIANALRTRYLPGTEHK